MTKAAKLYYRRKNAGLCVDCGKPREDLSKTRCSSCAADQARRSAKIQTTKKDSRAHYRRKKLYTLSSEEYQYMIDQQGGKCWICKQKKALHIDHCHRTGKIGRLLCGNCNRALGLFRDSPELLEKAAEYIRKYR